MSTANFYESQPEPNKSCFLALRHLILNHRDEITETVKYGMPCFCYGSKAVCYLWQDKKTKEPYVLWVEGRQLDHPLLEQGDRARMKILPISPQKDLPTKVILSILDEAIKLVN